MKIVYEKKKGLYQNRMEFAGAFLEKSHEIYLFTRIKFGVKIISGFENRKFGIEDRI